MTVKRNTIQRDLVLSTVNSLKNHVTADEVYEEIVKTHRTVSKATVYRNLNQLADSGEIRRVSVPNGADRFDYKLHHHYHAQCSSCGKVIDITMPHFTNLENEVDDADGFKLLGHDIIFYGLCKDCQKN